MFKPKWLARRKPRRTDAFALLIALAPAFASAAEPSTRDWNFDVLLDGKPIGHHNFHLVRSETGGELTSQARFTVKILFVTAYRYVHDATEVWRNGCLERIASTTDDNGKKFKIEGALKSDGFVVSDGKTTAQFPQCSMTFAYWNPQILTGTQLVNIQTGKYDRVTISHLADENFVARGVSPGEALVLQGATGRSPVDGLRAHRGWSEREWSDATAGLQARGWLEDDGTISAAGAGARDAIEADTDRLALGPYRALGDDATDELVGGLRPLAAWIMSAGAVPAVAALADFTASPARYAATSSMS